MEASDVQEENESLPFTIRWNNPDGGYSEGPLSLLWSLIESYKVDIFDVSLSKITEDFIKFIQLSKNISIELSTDFIKMAANLVYLKSKSLLPNPGFEEIESDAKLPKELVEKLLEHKKFQLAGKRLGEIDEITSGVFRRESNQILIDFPTDENWLDLDLIDLISAFNSILQNKAVNEEVPNLLIANQDYSIDKKIQRIEELLQEKNEINFFDIFDTSEPDTYDVVFSFLALLEIVKLKKVAIKQHKMFGNIKIFLVS
ncbi:MAG TPA: segregation/condensation protein A [Leptospiraceae bacterium]|nr:segregation/condensation protein A [Leptospiraceae bacterium]HMW04371.1 segregation/condensation protein A [Leptospiraceae bacterium]HMX31059.1 segregation/condensation protein A [Leptospiraceae bacterium]HMY31875.1 segregation/condensation protein A [Leptospiraceae bacterium]HMZ63864.1 segregation/condensation protein A [Leptospiraceae bacterium]